MCDFGRTYSTLGLGTHLASASLCFSIVLVELAPFYLPVLAGDAASGVYTGDWVEYKGWRGKTWHCVFEFETANGTFKGTLAGEPDNGEENKREICLVKSSEHVIYYPSNPNYYYPWDRSKPTLFNYPSTVLALATLGAGLFYIFSLLFVRGRDDEGDDFHAAILWGTMFLAFLPLI